LLKGKSKESSGRKRSPRKSCEKGRPGGGKRSFWGVVKKAKVPRVRLLIKTPCEKEILGPIEKKKDKKSEGASSFNV